MIHNLEKFKDTFKPTSVIGPGSLSWIYPVKQDALEFGFMSSDGENLDCIYIDGFPNGIEKNAEDIINSILLGHVRYIKQKKIQTNYYFQYGQDFGISLRCEQKPTDYSLQTQFVEY